MTFRLSHHFHLPGYLTKKWNGDWYVFGGHDYKQHKRASGNYGKRRVCQGQCLLYSKRLLWNPFCCQLTFSPWENAFYQSLLTLGGCRLTQNLGTKQSQGKIHDLVLLLEEKDGSRSHPGSPTCHQIAFWLPPWKDKLAPVLKVLVAWSGQFTQWQSVGKGRPQ